MALSAVDMALWDLRGRALASRSAGCWAADPTRVPRTRAGRTPAGRDPYRAYRREAERFIAPASAP
jgi:L-alanine-DL-glutamate epimerase-like enolase superfamily enzyme